MELPPALRQAVDEALEGVALADPRSAPPIVCRAAIAAKSATAGCICRTGSPHRPIWRRGCRPPMRRSAPASPRSPKCCPDFAPASLARRRRRSGLGIVGRRHDCWDSLEEATLVETSDAIRKVGKQLVGSGLAGHARMDRRRHRDRACRPCRRPTWSRSPMCWTSCRRRDRAGWTDRLWQADRRHARRRRTGNAGRLAAHTGGPRSPHRGRRASCRALSAPGGLPARGARLVPFRAPRRPLPPAPAGQECRRAVGGREVHLHRRVEERRATGPQRA